MNDTLAIINLVLSFIMPLLLSFTYIIRKLRKSSCHICRISESDLDIKA